MIKALKAPFFMDWIELIILFSVGVFSFTISTVTGGGGAMTLLPLLNLWFGVKATAPILNLAMTIGRPVRFILFWKSINWKFSLYYIPTALLGVWLGSFVLLELPSTWFQLLIGLFLMSTVFQFNFGKKKRSFNMKKIYFAPLGLVVGFLGTLTGGLGPVLNPFYLNSGLEKEELIGTKTANSFLVGVAQVWLYADVGILNKKLTIEGLVLGAGIILGIFFGKRILKNMSSKLFHFLFLAMMFISGFVLVFKALMVFF